MNLELKKILGNKIALQLGKPFFFFIGITFAAFLISSAVYYYKNQDYGVSLTEQLAHQAGDKISIFFQDLEKDLQISSQLLGANSQVTEEGAAFLKNILQGNSAVLEITFFAPSGNQVAEYTKPTTGSVIPDENIFGEKYFQRSLQARKNYLDEPFLSDFNIPFVFWLFPIRSSSGEIYGVMRTTIDLSAVWVRLYDFSESIGNMYVLDQKGSFLFKNNALEGGNYLEASPLKEADLPQAQRTSKAIGVSGEKVMRYGIPIPATPWFVLSEVPLTKILGGVYLNLLLLGGSFLLLLIVLWREFSVSKSKLIIPLSQLMQRLSIFGKSDSAEPIHLDAKNELDSLAETFNEMMKDLKQSKDQLQRYNSELEQTISERTEELQKKNEELEKFNQVLVNRELKMIELKKELEELKARSP